MILGGQHFSAALLHMQDTLTQGASPIPRADLPKAYLKVEGEVLAVDTPLEVCRRAAGEHQVQQHGVTACTTWDTMQYISMVCMLKVNAGKPPQLTDNELYQTLCGLGMASEDSKLTDKTASEGIMSLATAMSLDRKKVRDPLSFLTRSHVSFLSATTPCARTPTSCSSWPPTWCTGGNCS